MHNKFELQINKESHLSKRRNRASAQLAIDNTIKFDNYVPQQKQRTVNLIPKSINQEKYIDILLDEKKLIVFATGPAGTGKTMLAVLAAIKAYKEGECSKIVITRPAVGVDDEKHGFLPGDLNAKMEPWTRPIMDIMQEYYRPAEIAKMLDEQIIEISPLAFMRGRTFKNSWIIADEMQNATPAQAKMLMTRIGTNSKIVITGDVEQADRNSGDNGLMDLVERLRSSPVNGITVCPMENRDVQRHKIIGDVLKLYSD